MRPAACDPGPKIHSWRRIQPQKPTQPVLYKSKLSLDLNLNRSLNLNKKLNHNIKDSTSNPNIKAKKSTADSKLNLTLQNRNSTLGKTPKPAPQNQSCIASNLRLNSATQLRIVFPHQPQSQNSNSKPKLSVKLELRKKLNRNIQT